MKVSAALLLAIVSAGGYAATEEQDAHPLDEPVQRAASTLAQREDPDSLAAAAVLTLFKDRAGAEQLAARASAAGPKRPDLLWLHAQLCETAVPGCDRKPIDARLRALDPENGITFLAPLGAAARAGNSPETDRLLDAVGSSKRVDIYWNTLIGHLATTIASTKELTVSQSVVAVTGAISATSIPPLLGTALPCRGEELQREGRRARCQGIVRALQQGDTAIMEMASTSLVARLWPEDSPEGRAAREARRIFDYRISITRADSARRLTDEAAALQYIARTSQYRREQDVIVAEIVAQGRSPVPPADWSRPPPG